MHDANAPFNSLYRDVQVIKRNCPQDVHLVSLDVETEVIHLGHVHRPENPEEGEARDIGVRVFAIIDGGDVRHHLPEVELLPVLDIHGLGGEGEAVG